MPGPKNLDKLKPAEDIATALDNWLLETKAGMSANLTGEYALLAIPYSNDKNTR
jgi:hypothetical protein